MMKADNKKYQNLFIALYALLLSMIFITIYSRSSPLYPMQNWEDVNCYFTVGKTLKHGWILYKDIFEQKGPLLHFLFMFITYISETSFIGLYIVEIIKISVFLFYSFLLLKLFSKNTLINCLCILYLANSITVSQSFVHGGSAEELNICFMVCSLYVALKDLINKNGFSNRTAFIIGSFSAVAFWEKYTICGFYLGLIIFVLFHYLKTKEYQLLTNNIKYYLIGFSAVTIPIIIYFVANGALYDLWYTYFYSNIFMYSMSNDNVFFAEAFVRRIAETLIENNLLNKFTIYLLRIIDTLIVNYLYNFFVIIGLLLGYKLFEKKYYVMILWFSIITLSISSFAGASAFIYYGYTICVFSIFGLAVISTMIDKYKLAKIVMVAMTLFSIFHGYKRSINIPFMSYNKDDLPQYKFAEIINKHTDKSLLNYGFIDSGFYFATDTDPVGKYFCHNNQQIPEMNNYLDSIVEEGRVNFVVSINKTLQEFGVKNSKYNLIAEEEFANKNYYLYKLQ